MKIGLKKNKELQVLKQANIAMCFKYMVDLWKAKKGSEELTSEDIHIIANAAASYFVDLSYDQNPFKSECDEYRGEHKNANLLTQYLKREENYLKGPN